MAIARAELKSRIYYDEFTGVCTWLKPKGGKVNPGSIVGCKHKCSTGQIYLRAHISGAKYLVHRLIFLYMTGEIPDGVDHINGDTLDNRWCNLRPATHAINAKNQRIAKNNTSGVIGVSVCGSSEKPYLARIMSEGKSIRLGVFSTLEEAACARKQAEGELGFHANHGSKTTERYHTWR